MINCDTFVRATLSIVSRPQALALRIQWARFELVGETKKRSLTVVDLELG